MMLENFTDVRSWAQAQWGAAQLGDSRRTKRARVLRTRFANAIGAAMAENPQASLPDIMQGWNEIRAAYRLFATEDVTHAALLEPHINLTTTTAENHQGKVVLFVQDTTELDYTHQKQVQGLGHIGDGKGKGIMLHSCLAIVPTPANPLILGLAGQMPWLRGFDNNDKAEVVPELLRTDSEGEIWAEMVESIGCAPAPETGSQWVSVGDRGSIFVLSSTISRQKLAVFATHHSKPCNYATRWH
ncbi:IS4/Tn5 family transposase DNA-binding protein [Scytonema sp. HK-05]|uniref:IS4/Tn5 family transposase DNA-binding protein n=1 Tax=Scytonema sp. HK-05 TaxID=1137095 RepID=UPI0009F8B8A2|nr:transposase DNA-binding-containing protein [Scytonema sp. HK-05]